MFRHGDLTPLYGWDSLVVSYYSFIGIAFGRDENPVDWFDWLLKNVWSA